MKIIREDNKIYFNNDDKSFANVTINTKKNSVFLELIKVLPTYRKNHLASRMLSTVMKYIKNLGYKIINLNPLPLDMNGLNLTELINFYQKYNFKSAIIQDRAYPYMMSRNL